MDLLSYSRWYDYSRARDAMFHATDRPRRVPLPGAAAQEFELPKRQKAEGYVEPKLPVKTVPEEF